MRYSYEELLSGDPLEICGVGHIRSPFLKEIKPSGIGLDLYHNFLAMIAWNKEEFMEHIENANAKRGAMLKKANKLSTFNLMTAIEKYRSDLQTALDFFFVERIGWDSKKRVFTVNAKGKLVGKIDENNFDEIRDGILQLSYAGAKSEEKPLKFTSKIAEKVWEKAQKYKRQETPVNNKSVKLGNIISKLCCISNTYNLLNVYELTVYQLYDQYFQCSYLRAMNLSENTYAHNGGDKFKFQDWQNPITNI